MKARQIIFPFVTVAVLIVLNVVLNEARMPRLYHRCGQGGPLQLLANRVP
jgi:hypothetical protein